MVINKIDNIYIIKLIGNKLNTYDPNILEQITTKIIKKINNLKNNIHLEFYSDERYGTIIKLTDYKSKYTIIKEKTVKITIHTESPFLYQIDYFNINNNYKKNIYYYNNKFYIEINNNITDKEYLKLLEEAEVIYEESLDIIDKAIKI